MYFLVFFVDCCRWLFLCLYFQIASSAIGMARLSPFFGWSWFSFNKKPQNVQQHQIQSIEVHASITSNKDYSLNSSSITSRWSGTKNENELPYHEEQLQQVIYSTGIPRNSQLIRRLESLRIARHCELRGNQFQPIFKNYRYCEATLQWILAKLNQKSWLFCYIIVSHILQIEKIQRKQAKIVFYCIFINK